MADRRRGASAPAAGSAATADRSIVMGKRFREAEGHAREGRLGEASAICEAILREPPRHAAATRLLGAIKAKLGNFAEAVTLLSQAAAALPDDAALHNNLGAALIENGERGAGLEHLARAIEIDPAYVDAWDNLIKAWHREGRLDDIVGGYRKLLALRPDDHLRWTELGRVLLSMRRYGEAEAAFRKTIELAPERPAHWLNLGAALDKLRRIKESMDAVDACLARAPDMVPALNNKAGLLSSIGRHDEALALYRRALELTPAAAPLHSNALFASNYAAGIGNDALLAAHLEWGRRHGGAAIVRSPRQRPANGPALTIGYVSADFMAHPVAYFMGALLAAHDRRRFRVICYASVRGPDAVTRQVRKVAPEWRDVAHLGDEQLAKLIAEDEVDVLVDLGGHTANNRLTLFALKPAAVQVSYLGYPNTTGLAAIDYRLTDAWADPPGLTDRWHTERLIRLPGGFLSYTPPANIPDVSALPALGNGYVTFGSYNNFAKTSQATIALWTSVLAAVPNSRLVLKASFLDDPGTAAEVLALFAAAGADPQRLTLRGRTRGHLDHIRSYGALDIALDPHPYNGTTTTCEALWMGVPVLTLAGDRHSSRVGTSILTAAGLDDFIAISPEDYVARARSLSSDLQELASLRLRLRAQVSMSPLADPKRLARAIEAAYLRVWRLRER